MDRDLILSNVGILLGIGISDITENQKLEIYLDLAIQDVMDYTKWKLLDASFESILIKMVMFLYGKAGKQAIVSQSYSGVSETYAATDSYPNEIMKILQSKSKARFI